jgi:hypothetical protein
VSKTRHDERNTWLDAAPYFQFPVINGAFVFVTVRRDLHGMWAVLLETPGHAAKVWDGDAWQDTSRVGWRGQYARNTALRLAPKLRDRERAEYEAWQARRAAQQAEPVEEHLAEHASTQNGAAA